ncbi:MAG: DUF6438 domain-containing protein [Flavicella sp.]
MKNTSLKKKSKKPQNKPKTTSRELVELVDSESKPFKPIQKTSIDSSFKFIRIERGSCYGFCPMYSLEINQSGSVCFIGDMFVEKLGKHEWNIEKETIDALNNAIKKFMFFDLEKTYSDFQISDLPTCTVSVTLKNGESRTIVQGKGKEIWPEELKLFQKAIDKVAGTYIGFC